jgi:hypothetical protein
MNDAAQNTNCRPITTLAELGQLTDKQFVACVAHEINHHIAGNGSKLFDLLLAEYPDAVLLGLLRAVRERTPKQ